MSTKRLTVQEARKTLEECGVAVGEDFHALDSDQKSAIRDAADARGYKAPNYANGSRLRYFHEYLQRTASRDE